MEDSRTFIFDIEKFAVHDGPGIRSVVFMKGCPLRCIWCHNPESQSFSPEIFFTQEKCIGCGWCAQACPNQCHLLAHGNHTFDRADCIHCGLCTTKCYADALEIVGKSMTVSEVMADILKDRPFYENSGGGLTLSGGEPLAHFPFTQALLQAAKEANIHTAIETSGYADVSRIASLLPWVDLWLWDVKASPSQHKRLTGVENDIILGNLQAISQAGATIILRCPIIPDINDSQEALEQIIALSRLPGVQGIDLEPYHPLGESKNKRLDSANHFQAPFASKERIQEIADFIQARTRVPVHKP